jgi:hypothetical protein
VLFSACATYRLQGARGLAADGGAILMAPRHIAYDQCSNGSPAVAMKCFKVVQKVLEDTYQEIPGDEAARDAAISRALSDLSSAYRTLLNDGGPDFADPVTRFAYVYSYVPAHAHWIHELLEKSEVAAAVFSVRIPTDLITRSENIRSPIPLIRSLGRSAATVWVVGQAVV